LQVLPSPGNLLELLAGYPRGPLGAFLASLLPFPQGVVEPMFEIRRQQFQGLLGQADKFRGGAGFLEQPGIFGEDQAKEHQGEADEEGPFDQGEARPQQALEKVEVQVVEEALEVMGQQAGEPVNRYQDDGKGEDAGPLGVSDPPGEEPRQIQVGMGGGHNPSDHPHQDRQFLKKAPKISPDGDQAKQDQDSQV